MYLVLDLNGGPTRFTRYGHITTLVPQLVRTDEAGVVNELPRCACILFIVVLAVLKTKVVAHRDVDYASLIPEVLV